MLSEEIDECIELLNKKFGEDFVKNHPDVVIQLLQAYRQTEMEVTLGEALTGERADVNIYDTLVAITNRLDLIANRLDGIDTTILQK